MHIGRLARESLFELLTAAAYRPVAFARGGFECEAVDHVDLAAAMIDDACRFERPRNQRHGRTSGAGEAREVRMRHRDRGAIETIEHVQQPAAHPRFHIVQQAAGGVLLRVADAESVVGRDKLAAWAPGDTLAPDRETDAPSQAGAPHSCPYQRAADRRGGVAE